MPMAIICILKASCSNVWKQFFVNKIWLVKITWSKLNLKYWISLLDTEYYAYDYERDFFSSFDLIFLHLNPLMPNGAFNICCPRDCVSRHNGGTSGAPLKPLRVDSALRALSSLRGYQNHPISKLILGDN